jgi:hypothetical protein
MYYICLRIYVGTFKVQSILDLDAGAAVVIVVEEKRGILERAT